jgi:hypothetical protein
MRLELRETGQSQVDGVWVGAANIWEREPNDHDGPSALYAQISVDEDPPVDVAEGDELAIAGRALACRGDHRGPGAPPRQRHPRAGLTPALKTCWRPADEGRVCLSISITHSATSSRPRARTST